MGAAVEVECEYVPETFAEYGRAIDGGYGLGVLLELAAHACELASPGCGLADLSFEARLPPAQPRLVRASVDLAEQRVTIGSTALHGSRALVHLRARIARLDRAELEACAAPAQRLPASGRALSASQVLDILRAAGLAVRSLPPALEAIEVGGAGARARVLLADSDCGSYRMHPLVADCGWLLSALVRGHGGAAPVCAQGFYVLEPGACIDALRVVKAGGEHGPLLIVAERRGRAAAIVSGLVLAESQDGLPAAGAEPVPERDVRARVGAVAADALGRPPAMGDLIEAGASSLELMRLLSAVQEELGVRLPAREFFEQPTLERLAAMCARALDRPSRDAVVHAARSGEVNAMQREIWTVMQTGEVGPAYNEYAVLELQGELDVAALEQALGALLRRHAALRSYVRDREGALGVCAADELATPLELVDLRAGGGPGPEQALTAALAHAREFARRPFELTAPPPFRACWLRMERARGLLVLCAHHLFVDGWSFTEVLVPELCRHYAAARAGDHNGAAPGAPPAPAAGMAWSAEPDTDDAAFFRHALQGIPPSLSFVPQKPRRLGPSFAGARRDLTLAPELVLLLDDAARRFGSTRMAVLLGALAMVVNRFTGEDAFSVGVPSAFRLHPELREQVGCFANLLPIPVRIAAEATHADLIAQVSRSLRGALARQHVPLSRIAAQAGASRRPGELPYANVVLAMQPELRWEERATGLAARLLDIDIGIAKTDLALILRDDAGALRGSLEYRTDVFQPADVERFAAAFLHGLERIAVRPEGRVAELELPTAADRARLAAWNDTARARPRYATLYDCVAERARREAERPAVIGDGQALSYGELKARCDGLAERLVASGLRGARIGVQMPRSASALVAALAIWKAGGVYVPIDTAYPAARKALIRRRARLAAVLTPSDPGQPSPGGMSLELLPELHDAPDPAAERGDPAAAYILFTSGSTGTPKGVVGHHRGLSNLFAAQVRAFEVEASDVVLQFAALGFDASLSEFGMALASGAALAIPGGDVLRSPERLGEFIRRHRVTVATLPPTLLAALDPEGLGLRCVISAGEPCSEAVVRKWERHAKIYNAYGPTEASVCATLTPCNGLRGSPPIGKPIDNVRVHVVDSRLRPLPPGWPGEICIAGDGVGLGYFDDPDATAERFVEAPSGFERGRMYRTGDLGRFRDDGQLEFLGRRDRQVKVRGHRVELGEIESALRQHPAVAQCRAVRVDHASGGAVHAYVQCASEITERQLKRHLGERLPPFCVPARIAIVDRLPTDEHGKVEVSRLPSLAESGPADGLAQDVAAIWAEVLGVANVDPAQGFFDQGGDSIAAIRVVELSRARGLVFAIEDLYAAGSAAELAALIGEQRRIDEELDLAAEAVLDPGVRCAPQPLPAPRAGVLLTGATGFLGAFLLGELLSQGDAPVTCVVRAPDPASARDRVRDALVRYGLWRAAYEDRLCALAGDLEAERLGLSPRACEDIARSIGAIVHCAAKVDLVAPYRALHRANVQGTVEVLRIAAECGSVPVHHVSTLGVVMAASSTSTAVGGEDPLPSWRKLEGGYTRSKWVAERLVLQAEARGLPVRIYRPGLIVADSRTGRGPESDAFGRLVRTCLRLGTVPQGLALRYLSPVDRVARSIAAEIRSASPDRRVLHMADPCTLPSEALLSVLQRLDPSLRLCPYRTWRDALVSAGSSLPLHPLLHLLPPEHPPELLGPDVRCDLPPEAEAEARPWSWLERFAANVAG